MKLALDLAYHLAATIGHAIAIDPSFKLDIVEWSTKPGIHLFETTSDDFFAAQDANAILGGAIDMIFIDGMHLSEFVLRDFVNVERLCRPGSTIILHDAVPLNFEMTERVRRHALRMDKAFAGTWTGDVWRLIPLLQRERPDLTIQVDRMPPTGLVLIGSLKTHGTVYWQRTYFSLSGSLLSPNPKRRTSGHISRICGSRTSAWF